MVWDSNTESTTSSRRRPDASPCDLGEQCSAIPWNYGPRVCPIGLGQLDTIVRLPGIRVDDQLSHQQGDEGHQVCTARSTLNSQGTRSGVILQELELLQLSRRRGQVRADVQASNGEQLGDRSEDNPENSATIDQDNREFPTKSTSSRTSTKGSSRRTNQPPLRINPPMMGNLVNPTLVQVVLQAINNQGNLVLRENLEAQYNPGLAHVSQASPQPQVGQSQPIYNAPYLNHPYHPTQPPIHPAQPIGAPPIQQPLVGPIYPPPHQSTLTYPAAHPPTLGSNPSLQHT
ncbi:hypothetical protein AMTR_s00006p00093270 [Amborella trichopoda]|uniref:Uncharacterized protein n=1 Tax=Amborella trichopoda TaxID=13333 RepID=W1PDD8_AMBTC|nr:hypothetical protein AMTR_s00006p00093270 [Amborella trichopoda]